jgi:hypothetical protein
LTLELLYLLLLLFYLLLLLLNLRLGLLILNLLVLQCVTHYRASHGTDTTSDRRSDSRRANRSANNRAGRCPYAAADERAFFTRAERLSGASNTTYESYHREHANQDRSPLHFTTPPWTRARSVPFTKSARTPAIFFICRTTGGLFDDQVTGFVLF